MRLRARSAMPLNHQAADLAGRSSTAIANGRIGGTFACPVRSLCSAAITVMQYKGCTLLCWGSLLIPSYNRYTNRH